MLRSRLALKAFTAVYFGAVVLLAFVPGGAELRMSWFWPLIAFVPVGTVLTLLMGRRRWWVAIGFGLLGAAWVEAAQTVWMPTGYAEVADVLWAACGVAIGVLVAFVVTAPVGRLRRSHDSPRQMTEAGERDIP